MASPSPRADLGRTAAKGAGVTLAVQAARTLLQLGSLVLLARLLVPADFGLVAMVMAVIGVADILRDFGLSLATMQARTLPDSHRTNLFWANLALGLACTLTAVAAAPLVAAAYGEPRLEPIVLVLASIFTVSGFTTQFRAGLARQMRFKAVAAVDLAAQLLAVGTGVLLAALDFGVWALVSQQLAHVTVSAVLFVVLAGWWPSLPVRGASIRGYLRFGAGVLGYQALDYSTKNVDNVAVGAALGAGALGFYDRAYQVMMMPLRNINAPLTGVAVPVLSRVQDDLPRLSRSLEKAQLVACYVTATLFAVIAGLSVPAVDLLFGDGWRRVAPILTVLAIGGMFRAVGQIAYWGYLATGRSDALLRQRIVTATLTVALIVGGLPWGTLGVAAGHSLAAALTWLVSVWHMGRSTGVVVRPLYLNAARALLLVGVPTGSAAHAATYVSAPAPAQLALGLVLAAVYAAAAAAAFPAVRRDAVTTVTFVRQAVARRRTGTTAGGSGVAV